MNIGSDSAAVVELFYNEISHYQNDKISCMSYRHGNHLYFIILYNLMKFGEICHYPIILF